MPTLVNQRNVAFVTEAASRIVMAKRGMADPIALARAGGMEPDPWQRDVLQGTAKQMLLCCSRQSGKSAITAALAVHIAVTQPDSLILLLSKSERQSTNLFKQCMHFYRSVRWGMLPTSEAALTLRLANGSEIVALPGQEGTVRSFSSVRLIVVDEGAFVPDELYYSVRPMLAVSGGRLIALSTPHGNRGWYYEAWMNGGDSWERHMVTAYECPRITPEFLEEERRALGEFWFSQEYECKFLDSESHAFTAADIQSAFEDQIETWQL